MNMDFVLAVVLAALGIFLARPAVAEADAHRLRGDDQWTGPVCSTCGGDLTWTLARCRANRHRQRATNFALLVVTPIVLVSLGLSAPSGWLIPAYVAFGFLITVLTVTDLDTQLIPNRILFPGSVVCGTLLVVGGLFASEPWAVARSVLGGFAYFVVMLALALVAKGALGFGDVKLAFPLGMFVGYLSWSHLVVAGVGAFVIGGIVSLVLLLTRRVRRTDAIAFGPFMTVAAFATIVYGTAFLEWYRG